MTIEPCGSPPIRVMKSLPRRAARSRNLGSRSCRWAQGPEVSRINFWRRWRGSCKWREDHWSRNRWETTGISGAVEGPSLMPFLMATLAWAMMALAVQLAIRAPLPGGAVVAVSRTLLAEIWRRGVLPVCGAILFLGLALLPSILEDSSEESSQLQTLLDYGQVWISSVLLLLSMWITSGSLSDEIVTGRMRVLVVHRYGKSALLPGKWLGSLWAILALLVPATAIDRKSVV